MLSRAAGCWPYNVLNLHPEELSVIHSRAHPSICTHSPWCISGQINGTYTCRLHLLVVCMCMEIAALRAMFQDLQSKSLYFLTMIVSASYIHNPMHTCVFVQRLRCGLWISAPSRCSCGCAGRRHGICNTDKELIATGASSHIFLME